MAGDRSLLGSKDSLLGHSRWHEKDESIDRLFEKNIDCFLSRLEGDLLPRMRKPAVF